MLDRGPVERAIFLTAHGTGAAPLDDRWLAAGSRLVTPGRTRRSAPPADGARRPARPLIRLQPRHLELALEALAAVGR